MWNGVGNFSRSQRLRLMAARPPGAGSRRNRKWLGRIGGPLLARGIGFGQIIGVTEFPGVRGERHRHVHDMDHHPRGCGLRQRRGAQRSLTKDSRSAERIAARGRTCRRSESEMCEISSRRPSGTRSKRISRASATACCLAIICPLCWRGYQYRDGAANSERFRAGFDFACVGCQGERSELALANVSRGKRTLTDYEIQKILDILGRKRADLDE